MENNNNTTKDRRTGDFNKPPSKLMPKKPELREIPIEKIRVSKYCQRDDYNDLDSLKQSIQKNGLFHFPAVTDDGEGFYRLIFGSRRYQAYKNSGEQAIPCHIIEATNENAAVLSFVENRERKGLNPVEEARKLKQMGEEFGWKDDELGTRIGWSQSVVAERLAILRLGDDILEKVDTRPESAFKFTHALALSKLARKKRSKLARKKRFNEEMEIKQLQDKTIEHRLSSTELKMLVELFKDGTYDRLPDRLRMYLLKSKSMTSKMAKLYLKPENVIQGEGKAADHWREIAQKLDKEQLEKLFIKAVKAEWAYERTCEKLLDFIKRESESMDDGHVRAATGLQRLLGDISMLQDRLAASRNEILELTESNPKQLEGLCTAIGWLQSQLEPFLRSLKKALAENTLKQSA